MAPEQGTHVGRQIINSNVFIIHGYPWSNISIATRTNIWNKLCSRRFYNSIFNGVRATHNLIEDVQRLASVRGIYITHYKATVQKTENPQENKVLNFQKEA